MKTLCKIRASAEQDEYIVTIDGSLNNKRDAVLMKLNLLKNS